jgi:hypothetical protein
VVKIASIVRVRVCVCVFLGVTFVGMEAYSQEATGAPGNEIPETASAAPTEQPPPPPDQPPPPPARPSKKAAAAKPAPAPEEAPADDDVVYSLRGVTITLPAPTQEFMRVGQWVYTTQYGWVYMPYGDQYISPGTAADPSAYAYAYYPSSGWTWLSTPLVSGSGSYFPLRSAYSGRHLWPYGGGYSRFLGPGQWPGRPGGMPGPRPWGADHPNRPGQPSDLVARDPASSRAFTSSHSTWTTGSGSPGAFLNGSSVGSSTLRGGSSSSGSGSPHGSGRSSGVSGGSFGGGSSGSGRSSSTASSAVHRR